MNKIPSCFLCRTLAVINPALRCTVHGGTMTATEIKIRETHAWSEAALDWVLKPRKTWPGGDLVLHLIDKQIERLRKAGYFK